ncbi:hypothetical protein [Alicyclobacillus sp. SO9]|uniref:hypothetical protein n=1 Tax=Alicyclobacillus sp. SO9 TaxID=2665646 RepID=UPI0018E7D114|nr:hypothetical protein [Alicyclobacillus sp. SO9]QQE77689.1 hypothetical protein GI364_17375 [Alicyclobacillus sp. SO9]
MNPSKKKPSLFSMTMITVTVLFVSGYVAGVHIPVSHAQPQTSKASAHSVTVTSKSTAPRVKESVSFPAIIDKALQEVHAKGVATADAPTVLPTSVLRKGHLLTRVTVQTKALDTAYNVLFTTDNHRVADFSENKYKTSMAARTGTFLSSGSLPKGTKKSSVKIGSIEATSITYQPTGNHSINQGSPFALVQWTQNRWSITVRDAGTSTIPLPEAQKVAHFVVTHGLPAPNTQASLLVTVQTPTSGIPANLDGRSVSAYAVWQDGKRVYETDAYTACEEPVETVFSMARSMESYP